MPASAALKISANSTRRTKWHSKLGFCRESWPFTLSLNAINEQGGLITRMKAIISRIYPTVYIIKEAKGNDHKTGK